MTLVAEVRSRSVSVAGVPIGARLKQAGAIQTELTLPHRQGSAGSGSLVIDNGDGALTLLFRDGRMIGQTAEVRRHEVVLFRGTISQITMGGEIQLTLDSGGLYRLYDAIPLRRSTEWTSYVEDSPLPIVFGEATVAPVQYDATGRAWVVAEGTVETAPPIGSVQRDGLAYTDYQSADESHPVSGVLHTVRLGEPLLPGESLEVNAKASTDTFAGALEEVLALAAVEAPSGLQRFRALTNGQRCHGALTDASVTISAVIDEIVGSVGGAWSENLPGFATLFPAEPAGPIVAVFGPWNTQNLRGVIREADVVSGIRVQYARNDASGEYAGTVAFEVPRPHHKVARVMELRWPFAVDFEAVSANAIRLLSFYARPMIEVTWDASMEASIELAQWVEIRDPRIHESNLPVCVVAKSLDPQTETQTLTAVAFLGAAPVVELTYAGERTVAEPISPAVLVSQGSIAVITFRHPETELPLVGATVTLDNGAARRVTDSSGSVQFDDVPFGPHAVVVEHADVGTSRFDWVQGA